MRLNSARRGKPGTVTINLIYQTIFLLMNLMACCAFDVLEHIEDDNAILKTLRDALKPGGFLFVTVPADKRLWSAMDIYAEHKRRYSYKELREKIEGNGFKVIKMSYFMTFLYPLILLSRKLSVQEVTMSEDDRKEQLK